MSLGSASNFFLGAASATGGGGGYEIKRSLRFNSADTAYLDRTPSSASNRKTFTFSCWVKASNPGLERIIFQSANSWFRFNTNDAIYYYWSGSDAIYTDAVLRDTSAWYHLILAVDTTDATASNRIKIYKNGVQQSVSGTQPSQDANLDFNNNVIHYIGRQGSNLANMFNGYLAEVHFVDGQQLAATDFGEYDSNNVWQPKDCKDDLTYGTNGFYLKFADNSSNSALGTDSSGNGNTWNVNNLNAVAIDYVQSTTGTLYSGSWDQAFNGSTSTPAPYIYNTTASVSWDINISGEFEIYTSLPGTYNGSPTVYTLSNGATYSKSTTAAEWINLGTQTNVTSLSVNAPDPGTYIFAIRVDGSILVSTTAGDTDSLIDSPTNYTAESGNNGGNYATINSGQSSATLTNGNLNVVTGTSGNGMSVGTIGMSSGKYYWEVTLNASENYAVIGIVGADQAFLAGNYVGLDSNSWGYQGDGNSRNGNSTSAYGNSYVDGDVIGVAFDADTGSLYFYKNGTVQNSGTPVTTSADNGPYFAAVSDYNTGTSDSFILNFGQRSFEYTVPTDYVSLVTTNLSDSTIADGGTAMNVALYTGNGGTNAITGLGFSPDILWLKSRSNATFPALANSVVGPNYFLRTNDTTAENGPGFNDDIVSFDSDGFTLGADTYYAFCNTNTYTYVGWAWDSGTTTASNTDGTITSQVRANQSTGCSVVSYTSTDVAGATVGHGLNALMVFAIFKNRDRSQNWLVYHKSLDITSGEAINLNQSNAAYASAAQFNSTLATSSVFTLGTGGNASNAAGDEIIAFCFAAVEGYSDFGSYAGNGNASGPFVYTGFRPKWVMVKSSSNSGEHWLILDTERDPYNLSDATIYANLGNAEAEAAALGLDILSNGFKPRGTNAGTNASGYTYIYAAFAEHPFKTARAR